MFISLLFLTSAQENVLRGNSESIDAKLACDTHRNNIYK